MIRILKKIQSAATNRTTYRVGLLQAKAFRILKNRTGDALSKYGISSVEWAFLGLLFENSGGMRSNVLAQELGVEAPFITALFANLKKKGFVDSAKDAGDSRAKILTITLAGSDFVGNTEREIRNALRPLVRGSTISDLLSYISILESIIENEDAQ